MPARCQGWPCSRWRIATHLACRQRRPALLQVADAAANGRSPHVRRRCPHPSAGRLRTAHQRSADHWRGRDNRCCKRPATCDHQRSTACRRVNRRCAGGGATVRDPARQDCLPAPPRSCWHHGVERIDHTLRQPGAAFVIKHIGRHEVHRAADRTQQQFMIKRGR